MLINEPPPVIENGIDVTVFDLSDSVVLLTEVTLKELLQYKPLIVIFLVV